MKRTIITLFFVLFFLNIHAGEGFWLPINLQKYNIEQMQEMGFKLSASDIYHPDSVSLTDGVALFGRGCTGEFISGNGLLITNYHCALRYVQNHSSVQNDLIENGFWAAGKDEELKNPGLSIKVFRDMKDVTSVVLHDLNQDFNEEERADFISKKIDSLKDEYSENGKYLVSIKPFFYGNEYYMYRYIEYNDVRLVAAPPSGIGKFGGDLDNWMWPRHTGDFALFRVYADENNEPAEINENNQPFKPKHHFKISTQGYEKGDFSMVLGFPASSEEYLFSEEVMMMKEKSLPQKIRIRSKRLEIMDKFMKSNDAVKIQYTAKYNGVSNAWKKWQGMLTGFEKVGVIDQKTAFEKKFIQWLETNPEAAEKYAGLFSAFDSVYRNYERYYLADEYYYETVYGSELMRLIRRVHNFAVSIEGAEPHYVANEKEELLSFVDKFFKDYYKPLDQEIFPEMILFYKELINEEFFPEEFSRVMKRYEGKLDKYADKLYRKTDFLDRMSVVDMIDEIAENGTDDVLKDDPAYVLYSGFNGVFIQNINDGLKKNKSVLDSLYRKYMMARRVMAGVSPLYPDANFTLRVSYGEITGYEPKDGVWYKHQSTEDGILEKSEKGLIDYDAPEKLIQLLENKEFGKYGENGRLNICFVAANHTSGGNSGSPVLNDNGELIGINFDRCWEGTMSDVVYDKKLCRNIILDVRYVLFLIDEYAESDYLLEELEIVN